MLGPFNYSQLDERIKAWLYEDMPTGDVTSQNLITGGHTSARLIAKETGIVCGMDVFLRVMKHLDDSITLLDPLKDGDTVEPGTLIAHLKGPLDKILMGERLALNLLQRLSGIATLSNQYALAVKDYPVRIVDTRKTTPGLRDLEKYAVRIGGCHNHRTNLSDAVMIKDNHIKAAGGIQEAVNQIRKLIPHTMKIEVEVESLEALESALEVHADIIMLDNMSTDTMAQAVLMTKGKSILEASGNMTLDRLVEVAATGVDIISVGALTHSVKSLDISLKFT